ncbi:predicted protein, partial [Nematostella vectensis]
YCWSMVPTVGAWSLLLAHGLYLWSLLLAHGPYCWSMDPNAWVGSLMLEYGS